ncbi:RidA family protein [Maribacter sp. PR1]|uniref:RidA family protein n=1 Tax=Maribacter cobaltidurans TaxID=1178778 RepID=A0ABU7IYE5_9FLAO|nr:MULTISPECIES: RidA family protein [Maribacter]MDC6390504.1 RidA family protein [Maribacter sp. PR1]MEE1977894.1 RidA family protein [Maribacter cobaltidurans]
MSKIESELIELRIQLPEAPKSVANYIPAKRTGNVIYTAGQIPIQNEVIKKGKLGKDITLEENKNAKTMRNWMFSCYKNNLPT